MRMQIVTTRMVTLRNEKVLIMFGLSESLRVFLVKNVSLYCRLSLMLLVTVT